MTWSCTYCEAIIRLRTSSALYGTGYLSASSTARTEVTPWTSVHTPQIRCAKAHASRGSRPRRMISMPRTIVPDEYAAAIVLPSMRTSMRR